MARLLLVEDHDDVHRLLCEAIEFAGHKAVCVKTKADAAAAMSDGTIDLLICDILLPDGSGYDLAAMAADRGIKTLLMTGHPDEAQALVVSGVNHLIKPFRLDQFVRMIRDNTGG